MVEEISKSRKRRRKLKVSKAKKRIKKFKRDLPMSESSSDSTYGYDHKRKTNFKRKEPNSKNKDKGKDKRQYKDRHRHRQREKMETKKRRKRSPSPIIHNKRRRYKSISTSSDSDSWSSSSSYSSDTCSTCSSSSYSSSGGNRLRRRRFGSSRKISSHRVSMSSKRNVKKEHNKKTTDSYKNVEDEYACGKPNGKVQAFSRGYSKEEDMQRRSKKNHARERGSLSIHGEDDSCGDESQFSEPLSKSNMGETVSDNPVLEAQALELRLRKKALENLRRFRGFEIGRTQIPLSNKGEQTLCLDSREVDGTCNRACGTEEQGEDLQNRTEGLRNGCSRDNKRDIQQSTRNASSPRDNGTLGTNGSRNIGNKASERGDDDMEIASMNLNKESTCKSFKSEIPKLEEPAVKTSQDCAFRKAFVCERSMTEVLEACIPETQKSQIHMLNAGKAIIKGSQDNASQVEMSELDDLTSLSKDKFFKNGMIRTDKAPAESSEEDAFQTGMPKTDDFSPQKSEDSAFQQKTMAVKRGGEMVQVSYKVYIPQRSAALARRQFNQ